MNDIYNIKWNKLLGQGCFAHVIKARSYKEGTTHGLKVGVQQQHMHRCRHACHLLHTPARTPWYS
jgi:hypothetical protein